MAAPVLDILAHGKTGGSVAAVGLYLVATAPDLETKLIGAALVLASLIYLDRNRRAAKPNSTTPDDSAEEADDAEPAAEQGVEPLELAAPRRSPKPTTKPGAAARPPADFMSLSNMPFGVDRSPKR